MFSNGTEYQMFLEMFCFKCKKYVDYEETAPERPVCQIEEKLALCSITGNEEDWPDEVEMKWKQTDGFKAQAWECSKFEKE